jgi:hypothetical protein
MTIARRRPASQTVLRWLLAFAVVAACAEVRYSRSGCLPACRRAKTMTIGANFWRPTWGNGTSDYFRAGVDWAKVNDPWQPQLVRDLSYASVLRFMDWGPVNGSRFVHWRERIPKRGDQYAYTVPLSSANGASESGEGIAYEWQIDLANRTHSDLWINVPHAATDDFVSALAQLIATQLARHKKVYVEYSNELWNDGFYQHRYAVEQAARAGLPSSVRFRGKQVALAAWLSYGTYRALQVFAIFERVFGPRNPRLIKVLAGQLDNDNWPEFVAEWGDVHPVVIQHMAALDSRAHNPHGVDIDAYALAPYWQGGTVAELRASLTVLAEEMREARAALDTKDAHIPLIAYEGGQDGVNQLANARDPTIYQLTKDAYTRMAAFVDGPFLVYTHVGWDDTYAWGLKQATNASLRASHKYRATLDWLREQR